MRASWDVDGIAGRGRAGSIGPVLAMIAFAAVFAMGVAGFSVGGTKWELVGLLLAVGIVVMAAWLLLYRRFLDASLVLLTLATPLFIDVEVWTPGGWSYVLGWPQGFAIKLSDIFLVIAGATWFVDRFVERGPVTEPLGWTGIWLALFVASGVFFPFHSATPTSSFIEWTELMRFAAIFVLLAKRLESRDLLKWIVLGIAAQVWLQSLMSTAQYATGSSLGLEFLGERQGVKTFFTEEGAEPRAGGLMGHPNNLALFLVLVIPLLLAKTLTARSLLPRLGWGATFLVANEALLLSFSRFGWICSVLGFFAVYAMVNARERKPLWLGLGLPLFASLAVFVVLFAGFENFRDRLLEDDRGSAESRIEQFKTAIEILWHWPITGTGIGSYTSGAFRFVESQGPTSPALFMRVHNGSLLIAAELGLLGLIGYHAWYFQVLRRGWRSWRSADDEIFAVSIGVFVGLCAWFLKSMYNAHTPIMDPAVWLFAALMIATARFAKRDADATAGRQ